VDLVGAEGAPAVPDRVLGVRLGPGLHVPDGIKDGAGIKARRCVNGQDHDEGEEGDHVPSFGDPGPALKEIL
jgi:hypothetical protein